MIVHYCIDFILSICLFFKYEQFYFTDQVHCNTFNHSQKTMFDSQVQTRTFLKQVFIIGFFLCCFLKRNHMVCAEPMLSSYIYQLAIKMLSKEIFRPGHLQVAVVGLEHLKKCGNSLSDHMTQIMYALFAGDTAIVTMCLDNIYYFHKYSLLGMLVTALYQSPSG